MCVIGLKGGNGGNANLIGHGGRCSGQPGLMGSGAPSPEPQSLAGSGLTSLSCSAVAPMLRLPAPGLVTSTSAPVSST